MTLHHHINTCDSVTPCMRRKGCRMGTGSRMIRALACLVWVFMTPPLIHGEADLLGVAKWRQGKVTSTMTADTCWLYLYTVNNENPVYLDDFHMCVGTTAESGVNLIANPGFESGISSWEVVGDFASASLPVMIPTHHGSSALKLQATTPVASGGSGNSVKQNVLGLSGGAVHTLSFWYLATNAVDFTVRYSGHASMMVPVNESVDGTVPYGSVVAMNQPQPDRLRLTWAARTGQVYQIMNRLRLDSGAWQEVGVITANTYNIWIDLPLAGTNGFFNLVEMGSSSPSSPPPGVLSAPSVYIYSGATLTGADTATLNASLVSTGGLPTTVYMLWDFQDKGTLDVGDWANSEALGTRPEGNLSVPVSGFGTNQTVYYRCFASNSMGTAFSYAVGSFTMARGPTINNVSGATAVGTNTATLNGRLTSDGGLPTSVFLCWDTNDMGTSSPASWSNMVSLGVQSVGEVSVPIAGLSAAQTFYYRCFASNALGVSFAPTAASFTKLGSAAGPTVNHASGASPVGIDSAVLNANLTSTGALPTSVSICWDTSDKGTVSPASWTHVTVLGVRPTGVFSVVASGLSTGSTIYYRAYASNSMGAVFASPAVSVTTSNAPVDVSARKAILESAILTNDYGYQFDARYGLYQEPKSVSELEHMKYANLVYNQELVSLNPTNADYLIRLGDIHVIMSNATAAESTFNSANALPGLTTNQQAGILEGQANVALLNGDTAGAIAKCQALVTLHPPLYYVDGKPKNPAELATYALQYMNGFQVNDLQLPYDSDGMAFPVPQQADYSSNFVNLSSVTLVMNTNIAADDLRIQLLTNKLGHFGIPIDGAGAFTIRINTEPVPVAPSKAESYALFVTNNEAIINSYDAQGTLWGIVSLIQLISRDATPKIRICQIVDWPDVARRGYLQDGWIHTLEFALFSKVNTVVDQRGGPSVVTTTDSLHPLTPLQKAITQARSETFTALGLDIYYRIGNWTMDWKMPLSRERTFELHREICSEVARHGGHIYFPFDDSRFPLPDADIDAFGTGANMDAKYLTRLFQAVRAETPTFQMVFCPPFYWGPDTTASYPEPRDPYLDSLATYLDPDVDVFWTGPRVKGHKKTRPQVEWITQKIGRKPMIFQNATAPHHTVSYITDVTTHWIDWHYEGFFTNDITCYLKNAHMGTEGAQTTTLGDCLWNIQAYDASNSIRRGVAMLFGKDFFDILDPLNQALTHLDRYKYGAITPEALTETNNIAIRARIAATAYANAVAYNSVSLSHYPGWAGAAVGWYSNMVIGLQTPPTFAANYAFQISSNRAIAELEVGVNTNAGDVFLSPVIDMIGGQYGVYGNRCPPRFANWVYGSKSPYPRLTIGFTLATPVSGDYELHISAQDDEDVGDKADIRISVNDTPIFEGPNSHVQFGWSLETLTIPAGILSSTNVLTIENIEETDYIFGAPWFMVNYCVIKDSTP